MHKRILLLLLIFTILLVTTACGKPTTEETKDKKLTKKIELVDKKLGFNTTFTYDANEKYSDIEENNEGASTAIEFKNEEKDVTIEMYYNTMTTTAYNESQKTRSAQKYYKEYKYNDYEAYAYSEYPDKAKINVLLGIEDNMAEVLFVSIERIDNNEEIIIPDVLDKELKEFFNSMEFVKE